jgi:short subunit dehydrogenase-like uncharacterized protein
MTFIIAVYGASGYTGKLVVAELIRRGFTVVLAGRNLDRLAAVNAPGADRRRADTDDHDGLVRAFEGCDAVINCAGPFSLAGFAVVRAAIAAGCHYVDIAGEQTYLQQVFDSLGPDAAAAGVAVVPSLNDDGLPSDLLASLVAAQVEPVRELVIGLQLVPGSAPPTRGTLRSALANLDTFSSGGLGYYDGRWDPGIPSNRKSLRFLDGPAVPVVKFPLPAVVTVPRHVPARRVEGVTTADVVSAFAAVTPELIESLPEGPPAASRDEARWILVVEAVGADGRTARGVVHGADMQGITAVIAVEGARRLVADGTKSGVLAPAQVYDPADFLDHLAAHGVRWSIT